MVQNFVQSVSFQYIKGLVGLLALRSKKIYYERAMQDMKNRQNTESLETIIWVYRCEVQVAKASILYSYIYTFLQPSYLAFYLFLNVLCAYPMRCD